ncbi:MAG: adenylate/guanylate cyclase domain-containing protein [Thermoleophilaceae bacterium]
MPPETRYAKSGELNLAYQVVGDGPAEIVLVPSFVSHLEFLWADPTIKAWLDRITAFARVVLFDKAGTGLSDPVSGIPTLEERMAEIEAVMDAAGVKRPALFGLSEGGPSSILFAAKRPERVSALILFGSFAFGAQVAGTPDDIRRGLLDLLEDERYVPSAAKIDRLIQLQRHVLDNWGQGEAMHRFLPSRDPQQLALIERVAASPGMARATLESAARLNVTGVLDTLDVPTLIVHARDDVVPIEGGRFLADRIPGARMLEIEGRDHAPWLSDAEHVAAEIEQFLTGTRRAPQGDRILATVLFTDIVGSTERAAEVGDARWRAVLERHEEVARSEISGFDGTFVKSTGDGVLATFPGPAAAIRCAERLLETARPLEIELRAGIHTGECELIGSDVAGLGVHIAARVSAAAKPGEILVSRTVRDLVVGSGIEFARRGEHELRGVPGKWELLATASGAGEDDVVGDAAVAAIETPGPREGMRTGDRLAATVARRAPGVLRGLSRLSERRPRSQE